MNLKSLKKVKFTPYLHILVIIYIVIIFAWFKEARILATGEEGLLFYSPERIAAKFLSPWLDVGLGVSGPSFLPGATFFVYLIILDNFFTPWLSQAVIFLLLFIGGGVGMYLLAKELVSGKKHLWFIISLFYSFNLYSMVQVWNRFLTPTMFAWSFLPWFLLLFIKWFESGSFKWLIFWLISSLVFSNAFSISTLVITLWTPVLLWIVFKLIVDRQRFITYSTRTLIGIVLWLLTNIWWIYPFFSVGSTFFSEIFSWRDNFDTIMGVSNALRFWNYLVLYHDPAMAISGPWMTWYHLPITLLIAWLVFLIVILGITKSRRQKNFFYFLTLGFLALFVIKGTKPPLGVEFYGWLFKNIPQMGILRNPYEKFGITWLLPYSFFFGFGIDWVIRRFKKGGNYIATLFIVLTCGILVWPIWTGQAFTKDVRVVVPDYYEQANRLLNSKGGDGRLLMLPLIPGDAAKYTWGYGGIEASDFLFDKTSISRIFRNDLIDKKYWELYERFISKKKFSNILDETNVDYLVLRYDLDKASGASASSEVAKILDSNRDFEKIGEFDKIVVYEYLKKDKTNLVEASGTKVPEVSYSKTSATHYKVRIRNAETPFDLVFKTTFNTLWKAEINGQTLKQHSLAYGYANSWRVDKIGDYTINVIFAVWPWQ